VKIRNASYSCLYCV